MLPLRNVVLSLSLFFTFLSTAAAAAAETATLTTSIATAQSTSTQTIKAPACAASCIQSATESLSCGVADALCCHKTSTIQTAIASCVNSSSTCSEADKAEAIAFYPQSCAVLDFSTDPVSTSSGPGDGVLTASGTPPARSTDGASVSSLVLTADGSSATSETTLDTGDGTEHGHKLELPTILGITLAVVLLVTGTAAILVWAYLCRRQQQMREREPRMKLDAEFNAPISRPRRDPSVCGSFMVQPSPVEKDLPAIMGDPLSRSSTLVGGVSPATRLDKALPEVRVSTQSIDDAPHAPEKRESARNRAMNMLLGVEDRIRSSLTLSSTTSRNSKSSLMVEPLRIDKPDTFDETNKI